MDKKMTFSQYRIIDLFIFSILTLIFEGITTLATTKWFVGQPVAISLSLSLTLIVMFRWSAYSAIISSLGGAVFCLASGASAEHYLIYIGGNLFALISLVFFKAFGKKEVRDSFSKTLLFATGAYVAVAIGRWLLSLPFGAGLSELVGFLLSDLISLLFAVVALRACRSVDGLTEDQREYVLRVNKEQQQQNNTPYED